MFGGGEEYFQDPPEIDLETLKRFAAFCAKLREVEKPNKKTVNEISALARDVGNTMQAFELIVGTLFRHIKTWTETKQLTCWYILDKLCKEDKDKYGYVASKYILDIGRDYIPYENASLLTKYESLVEHWENVFPRYVVDALWLAKKERLWASEHPAEVARQQREEEEEWKREEEAMEDEDKLNDFGQPCMDYLQGRCAWGSECRLYHPPGKEGSLPPECRMGDWKCPSCGAINRHYRRRCSNCVCEKPQYKKSNTSTQNTTTGAASNATCVEDVLLSQPDPTVEQVLQKQFGYDPYNVLNAVAHWRMRFEHCILEQYLQERRAAYRVRILHRPATTALELACQSQRHFPEVSIDAETHNLANRSDWGNNVSTSHHLYHATGNAYGRRGNSTEQNANDAVKRVKFESNIVSGVEASVAATLTAQRIMERGVRDAAASSLYFELARHLQSLADSVQYEKDNTTPLKKGTKHMYNRVPVNGATRAPISVEQASVVTAAAKLAYTAWNTTPDLVPFVAPFFKALISVVDKIEWPHVNHDELTGMMQNFKH